MTTGGGGAPRYRGRRGARPAAVALLLGAAAALGACAQVGSTAADHHAGAVRHSTPTTAVPATTTSTSPVPSATPTTVVTPVVPPPGWSAPLTAVPPGGGFTSVSCLSDTFCIATGGGDNQADAGDTAGAGVSDSWDGATWADPSVYYPAPASGSPTAPIMPALSCTGGPTCVIVDGTDHVSTGDGTDWSAPVALAQGAAVAPDPADPGPGHPGSRHAAVDCPDPSFCAAVDNTGYVAVLQGGHWSPLGGLADSATSPPLYVAGPVGLSCPGPAACLAVVGAATFGWDGSTWRAQAPWTTSSGAAAGAALSCPAVSTCWVVGGHQAAVWTDGVWSAPVTVDPTGALDAVSCPTAEFCVAADATGSVAMWNGSSWSAPQRVLPPAAVYVGDPTSVSCPTARFCMVLDGDGDYTTFTGPPAPGQPEGPPAVAP